MQKLILLFLISLLASSTLMAQKNSKAEPYQSQWDKADSLVLKGLPKSAATVVQAILKDARRHNNRPEILKGQMYLIANALETKENAEIANINEAEQYIAASTGVEKAIWESITAQMFWNYYQLNRYKILNRTRLEENTSKDINTWDASAFFTKVGTLYLSSISDKKALQKVLTSQYAPIIIKGENTEQLRPTLYDLLVARALSYFQNSETGITRPANHFELEGGQWFAPATDFIQLKPEVKDSSSLHYQALLLYQEVMAFHLKDQSSKALIDADLNRLTFVHKNSVSPFKDSLYLQGLKNLKKQYPDISATAEVDFRIIQQELSESGNTITPYSTLQENTSKAENRNLPEQKKRLEQIIANFPKSEGGIHAFNSLQGIEQKNINIKTEEVNMPKENIRALLSYRNVDKIYLKLYRIPNKPEDYEDDGTRSESVAEIRKMTPISSWTQSLPGSEDMEGHSTEIKVDALSYGRYLLVASLDNDLGEKQNLVASTDFQVSNLSLILSATNGEETSFWLLQRDNGKPVAHANLIFWKQEYNRRQNKYHWKKSHEKKTNDKGLIRNSDLPDGGSYTIMVISGKDTFCHTTYLSKYYNRVVESKQIFFFTDRSIYRPGQTIYFKGIFVKSSKDQQDNEVFPNQKIEVGFYDANHQKIHSLDLTSNEYGSVSGSFTAPESGLTGSMSIQCDYGNTTFSVEEYKRPKFYVEFDTLKGRYSLNETVHIKGFAKAYAGNNLDGAAVKYRVVRRARFPYYWAFYRWGQPSSAEMEIANGEATTHADGSFTIDFETLPDRSIDPETLPVFSYTVHADVTDINGESRSGEIVVNAGYRSLKIIADVPKEALPENLDTLKVSSQNLNNVFVPTQLKMTIALLRFPGKIYRKRLWSMPDQFVMTESEFHQAFPNDEYKQEGDYHYWQEETPVLEKSVTTTIGGKVAIPKKVWQKEGWYILTFKGKDEQGKTVEEKKYVYITLPKNKGTAEKPLVVTTLKNSLEPGEKANIWLKTGFKNAYILQSSSLEDYNNGGILPGLIFNQTLSESDRGGIGFTWLYVYNNRVYEARQILNVPWSNKDLHLEWASHRNKVLPGAKKTWTITIKGDKKEKVAAELLAGMYDASLDAFKPHSWRWNKLFPDLSFYNRWRGYGFGASENSYLQTLNEIVYKVYNKSYERLATPQSYTNQMRVSLVSAMEIDKKPVIEFASPVVNGALTKADSENSEDALPEEEKTPAPSFRKNLQETAFFFPQLHTDKEGNVKFTFTMPEALTSWKFMAFAHTKDWKTGYLEGEVKTQKDLMVQPNLPRFLRQGDDMTISTKISNLSDKNLSGTARLEILNALTLKPVDLPFRLSEQQKSFKVAEKQSTTASWEIHVPESRYTPVILRISATAGDYTDGEENALPVITNRILVTETLPLPMKGSGSKNFSFDKLIHSDTLMDLDKGALVNHALTVEFTGNPAWYAVQALPYLMEYPYECSEQTFSRFYANALAAHIVAQSPKVEAVFKQWESEDTAALLSNLEKNQELKSALLEETPWVMNAKSETAQKHRIALLFQTHKLAKNLKKNLKKLTESQLPDGSFPWFKGMRGNRYITQYIVTGMAHLQHLGVDAANDRLAEQIVDKALPYLDEETNKDYQTLVKNKVDLSKQNISYLQIQYLYMRSYYTKTHAPAASEIAFQYYQKQAAKYWNYFNPYMKGMIALSLNRLGNTKTAHQIIASLKETAIHDEEMGMYWKQQRGYWWYQAPIESQSLLIETFAEVAKDQKSVDEMKTWLLKQKQIQNWYTTKATSDAVYALLLQGSAWLNYEPEVTFQLGQKIIKSTDIKTQAGTGYFKQRIPGNEIKPEMGHITVKVENPKSDNNAGNPQVSWGAVYWQYFEDMDKVTAAETPLSLKMQLYIEKNSSNGPVLTEIKSGNELKVGDKVKVRIVMEVDRDMDYVHLKNMRAACFEPVNVLSGYRYHGGVGYYESTKDVSTNFFFDHLRKGTYVFEYPVMVSQKGGFSNGITTIQCMYAPEFNSHTKGMRVKVK